MTPETPTDPQALREEIRRTRSELGETVEALAAKLDVKARASHAVGQAADAARERIRTVRDQATQAVATVGERVRAGAANRDGAARDMTARDGAARDVVAGDSDDDDELTVYTVPVAAIVVAVALVGVVIYLVRRRRS